MSPAAPGPGAALTEAAAILGPRAERDVPLAPLCTYRVGGRAALFVRVRNREDLGPVADAARRTGLPVLVVGRGSNLLVADAGFDGIALHLDDVFASVRIEGATVTAGGAALMPVVARQTARAGLTGFEWAVGVPGSMGGAVRMNAGGHGSDLAASITRAEVCDLGGDGASWWDRDQLRLCYRSSALGPAHLVLDVELQLAPGNAAAAQAELAEIVRWRRAHQPGGQNGGSVFANPPGDSAGRLIEAAGLKGHRFGTAEVSPRHANFIQADPGGRADDVAGLMRHVQQVVRDRFGVVLRPENHLIGFAPDAGPLPGREP